MNIFYLDENPQLAASYHCDQHVVKMIFISAQLLCTAVNLKAGEQITPYKSTHANRPCSVWVRESRANWLYVYDLMTELEIEWNFRYQHDKAHKSVEMFYAWGVKTQAERFILDIGLTPPALAMPESCKISSNPVECYREYYRKEKQALHKWTNREVPFWL